MRGRLNTVGVEVFVADRAHQGYEHAHHLRRTTGHYGIGCNLLDRCLTIDGWYASYNALWSQIASLQHGFNPFYGGRDHGQGVAEVFAAVFHRVFILFERDA